jgi:hypothetical protein
MVIWSKDSRAASLAHGSSLGGRLADRRPRLKCRSPKVITASNPSTISAATAVDQ